MRIVSLVCSNTEIVHELGLTDQLVGVDSNSDFPPEVKELPRLGSDLNIRAQKVKELKPDLVLASLTVPGMERSLENLKREGVEFLTLAPESIDDIYENIRTVAAAAGVEKRGEETVRRMQDRIEAVREKARTLAKRPKVYLEWWPDPTIAVCRRSWTHDQIEAAGGENVYADREVPSAPVLSEETIRRNPDQVVLSWCGTWEKKMTVDAVRRREGWERTEAVRNGRIHLVSESVFGRPGPRVAEGVERLYGIFSGALQF